VSCGCGENAEARADKSPAAGDEDFHKMRTGFGFTGRFMRGCETTPPPRPATRGRCRGRCKLGCAKWLRSWLRSWLRGPVAVRCSGASRVEHATRVLFPATRRKRFAAHVQTRRTSRSARLPICASENAWWSGRSAHASAGERARRPAAKHTRPAGNAPGGRVPPHCRPAPLLGRVLNHAPIKAVRTFSVEPHASLD
jgi:hypothetical protein